MVRITKSVIKNYNATVSAKSRLLAQVYFLSVRRKNLRIVYILCPLDIVIFANGNSFIHLLKPEIPVCKNKEGLPRKKALLMLPFHFISELFEDGSDREGISSGNFLEAVSCRDCIIF
jgi:hypothetical protein